MLQEVKLTDETQNYKPAWLDYRILTVMMLHTGINKMSDIDKYYVKDKENIPTLTSTF